MPFPKDFDPSKVLGLVLTRSSKLADGTVDERKYELDSSRPREELALLQAIEASLSSSTTSLPVSSAISEDAAVTTSPSIPLAPIASPASQPCELEPMPFSELVEKFMLFRTGVRDATKEMERSIFDIFKELIGDVSVNTINHQLINEFQECLMHLPSNPKKHYPNTPLRELTQRSFTQEELLSVSSINKYMDTISRMFNFAVKRGLMGSNVASGKNLKDGRNKQDIRRPFTNNEVKTIICESKLYQMKTIPVSKIPLYWINLIGMFTGMRLAEIGQLTPNDIIEVQADDERLWVFDINSKDPNKSLKNKNAKRFVPIHRQLLALGLPQYADARKQSGAVQLWDLPAPPNNKDWSYHISKRTSTFYQSTLKLEKQSFHCWRHNAADAMMKSGVSEGHQNAILGHAASGEGYGRYGKGFALQALKESVDKIQYDGVSFDHLHPPMK